MASEFEGRNYFPAIRTRPAEIDGYSKLADEIKDAVTPIITLGAWPRHEDAVEPMKQVASALGDRPFILDVTKVPLYQKSRIFDLLNEKNSFERWRTFVSDIANVVPMIQITSSAKLSQVIKQARLLESASSHQVAFRISNFLVETPKVIAALSALDAPEKSLVIIDAGYIRDSMSASLSACINTINDLREEIPEALITVISTSFPASVAGYLAPESGGCRGTITIMERELHSAIGADAAVYGDHASIHSKVYMTSGGRFMPRIDYPLNDAWEIERRPEIRDSQGYIKAAEALIEKFPSILEESTWGAEKIRNAARGDIDGMRTPARWIAARVNMHVTRQVELSEGIKGLDWADLDDGDL